MLYDLGQDWPHNPALAATWYRLAASNGSADAQLNLGYLYAEGDGLPADPVEGYARTYAAERLGHALAGPNLALMAKQLSDANLAKAQARGQNYLSRSRSLAVDQVADGDPTAAKP